jgi:hypothetical protein
MKLYPYSPIANKQTNYQLLTDPETLTTPLILLVFDHYGYAAADWDPLTIKMEFEADYGAQVPPENLLKIATGAALCTSDVFYRDLPRFINICNVLSGSPVDLETFDPADPFEILAGVMEAVILWPPENLSEPFSAEIQGYVAEVLKRSGIFAPVDVLRNFFKLEQTYKAAEQWGDDPDLYSEIYDNQKNKTKQLKQLVVEHFSSLREQLMRLHLRNGNVSAILTQLDKAMSQL